MTATLSIFDYIHHFLLNRDQELNKVSPKRIPSTSSQTRAPTSRGYSDAHLPILPTKATPLPQFNYGLMLAHVHRLTDEGHVCLSYSRRIEGHKNMDIYGIFVQDMIGSKNMKASQTDGRMSRASSVSDVSTISTMDEEDIHLQPGTVVTIDLLSSRSPSNIGSSEILSLVDYCKRNHIQATINIKFAHAYTWDNKYNREGLESLNNNGVKLRSVSISHIINHLISDVEEDLESITQLQTCRGTICMDSVSILAAVSALRQGVSIACDEYHHDQMEKLVEIAGQDFASPVYKKYHDTDTLAVFPIEVYRECILLQNPGWEWGKIKIAVCKITNGSIKRITVFQKVTSRLEKSGSKSSKNLKTRDFDFDCIWDKVGAQVTVKDLSDCDEIVIKIEAIITEYNGHVGWVDEITELHEFFRDKIDDGEVYTVRVETRVRYAHASEPPVSMSATTNGYGSMSRVNDVGITTMGFPKGMKVECLHVKDILLEMLNDLRDSICYLGSLDYERRTNLNIDEEEILQAIESLKKSIVIITSERPVTMFEDFIDEYAEEFNGF